MIKKFEYEITKHTAEEIAQVTVFCTDTGECSLDQVPDNQIQHLSGILNDKGADGWELVQVSFGHGGLLAFWKREL